MIPLGVAMGVPYMAVTLLTLWGGSRKWVWRFAIATTVLTLLGYALSDPSQEPWKAIANRALALGAIWITAALVVYRKTSEYLHFRPVAFHETVVDTALDAIITIDHSSTILSANRATEVIFGYAPGEIVGQDISILMPEPYASGHATHVGDYLRTGEAKVLGKTHELEALHKDGHVFPVALSVAEIRSEQGPRFAGTIRDISERKAREAQLIKRGEELEESNRQLDEFAYVASHDLRAPLRAIDNLASWITEDASDELNEESKRHLALLGQRVHRMDRLLDELLQYSRVGRVQHEAETVDTQELTREIADLFPLPEGFSIDIDPDMPALFTLKVPLEQVLRNLIGNAIKHHDKADGRVRVSATQNGQTCRFTVRDDGPGIPAKYHDKVFKMFQSLQPRDQVESTGMGLALVKKIVENQGGEIQVISEEGQRGATFEFTWPTASGEGNANGS